MSQSPENFDAFLKQRQEASDAFVNGNFSLLDKISVHSSPATSFGPKGDYVQGAKRVNEANAKGASHFKPGSENTFEVLHKNSDDNIAYLVGIQHAVVQMEGKANGVRMALRVTEIFGREKGHWKLFHRHADPLKSDGAA